MNANHKHDPIQRLRSLADQEASRRATQKESNRARWPELAAIKDRYGDDCKIVWAMDKDGEIGKRPNDAGVLWCERFDEVLNSIEEHYKYFALDEYAKKRGRKV